ncbi:ABC-type transport auxiliary lipoprotein family protein [Legionella feeleii]|uniref:ABC transporter auxiliary component n=1 Tax=Legionella feeleii TaxID=453 RepID=A0A0W0THC1_9GAMM|nr:ABC-type transport auxiliary lipoprotein family protein [Legionella feeleii]KTC95000.1 transport protein [Legionella feeleii]SPX61782.1 ABC transporter auxiliary component [Legionella feeleii]
MNKFGLILLFCAHCLLTACSPIKTPITNQYKLAAFSNKQLAANAAHQSILVTTPDAVAGYQTEQMLYIQQPFELGSFAKNAWIDPPADMLFPLIVQSLQRSGYFYAVASTPHSEQTDYRLDTQLIALQQNFLRKPSVLDLVVKVTLTHVSDNRVVASKVISQHVCCPMDTPYGGVIAANRATENLTAEVTNFVVNHVKQDHSHR